MSTRSVFRAKRSGMGKFRQPLLYVITAGLVAISLYLIASGEIVGGAMGLCFFGGCGTVLLAEPAGVYGRKAAAGRRAGDADVVRFAFNRPHMAVMALGGVLMGAGAGLMGLLGAPIWFAWPAGAIALIGALMLASRAIDRRPVVTIEATGFFDRRILRAPLRWEHTAALSFTGGYLIEVWNRVCRIWKPDLSAANQVRSIFIPPKARR